MSSFGIAIQDESGLSDDMLAILQATATAALKQQCVDFESGITILLTDDDSLRRLNKDFRGIDSATDVLSFADDDPRLPGEMVYLGDIAISVPQAGRQAAEGGHSLAAELQLLVVHGVLHLCGHDHGEAREKAKMWQAQHEILTLVGAAITAPVFPHEPSE